MWSNFRILYIFHFALTTAVTSSLYQSSKTGHSFSSVETEWEKAERPVFQKKVKRAVEQSLDQNAQTSYEAKNDTRKFMSRSWNRNSVHPEIKDNSILYSYKASATQSRLLTVVGKTFSKSSIKGLPYKTTEGPTKSKTNVMRGTKTFTTTAIKTKPPDEKDRTGNSYETHINKTNTGHVTGQQTTFGNLRGDVKDSNEEQQTPSIEIHSNDNNSREGNNQSKTQNPINFTFISNRHQMTRANPSSARETSVINVKVINNDIASTTYPTETGMSRGGDVVKQSVETTVANTNQQEETVTLKTITQSKKIDEFKTEQHTTPLATPGNTDLEQTVSSRPEKVITLQENIHKSTTDVRKDLDNRKTDQPTTKRRTQTTDKSHRLKDSSKQGISSTLKEAVRTVHTTTPFLTPRHTTFYDSSSVLAATLGGAFLGGLLVFAMFYCKKRITRYIRGDYRRVPMEYDFELNPRLKS